MHFPIQTHVQSEQQQQSSRFILGCMDFGGEWNHSPYGEQDKQKLTLALDAALESGINFIDHADIYRMGKAEQLFGEVMAERSGLREQLIIQSKCGIKLGDDFGVGHYDLSEHWILHSVDQSLQRLQTDYLDVLLMHRPDPLMQPAEIAAAFEKLHASGKVRHFGVSNMHQFQIELLQQSVSVPLIVNQLEMSLLQHHWIDESIQVGMHLPNAPAYGMGLVEHSQLKGIQLQAWGSLGRGLLSGRDVSNESQAIKQTAQLVAQLAAEYQTSPEAIVLAWLMRHPAGIQPVIGTSNPARIKASVLAEKIQLDRLHWYQLYTSIRGNAVP